LSSLFGNKLVKKTNSLQLLHVGDRSLYKNFPEIAEAVISANRETNLRVVGGGSPTPSELNFALRAQDNGSSIKFLGSMSDDVLEDEYRKADFTVIGSRKEGFGYPFVESLTRGTPVIARSPNMWREFPFVISQSKLNFNADQILELNDIATSAKQVIELWDRLKSVQNSSINKLNLLLGSL
jgi:glycosyltransferase involved in cell wall biosynthesis